MPSSKVSQQAAYSHHPALPVDGNISVLIPAGEVVLYGDLFIPDAVKGIVVFAHGSGSSRHSPRNRYVAGVLHEKNIGTLLIDLLAGDEEKEDSRTAELRFNIPLLADRLNYVCHWVASHHNLKALKIGLFGASTGGGAALVMAAQHPKLITAVVSRGGRPDLAGDDLYRVKAPTLLIVGGHDPEVLALNKKALEKLNEDSKLDIIPRATHLFEEPGALEEVAALASQWFDKFLPAL